MVGPRNLFEKLSNTSIFSRGLPMDEDLQDVAVARVFSKVLNNGSIIAKPKERDNALKTCFINGWLHSDSQGECVTYLFASPLHRWFVEWKLQGQYPAPPIAASNLLEFVIDIIQKFSPKRLATKRTPPSGATQSIPEAQYQDEFYRSCSSYGNALITFPEYGTAEGCVDFFIPSKEWGVELLWNGDKLAEHSGRFSNQGLYMTSLSLKDYIILDFRTRAVLAAHPGENSHTAMNHWPNLDSFT